MEPDEANKEDNYMTHESLPAKLRVLRARQGLTLIEAAERLGIGRDTLSDLERGNRHPVMPTLAKIARGYGVPVEDLLEEPALAGVGQGKADAPQDTGQPEDEAPEARAQLQEAARSGLPMPEPSGHAINVQIAEGSGPTRVKITRTSFFELMRDVKAGRLSEEDAWQRFQEDQEEAG
jgi:transcriptional regulator with XRE-family HTH domain